MSNGKKYRVPGTVIGGKYEILKMIGEGGMSVVYLAMDQHLKTNWAVKEIMREGSGDYKDIITSLNTEIDMLKNLSHPRLPRIVDIIESEESRFIVEDFIPGQTLFDIIKEYAAFGAAPPQEDVVEWSKQLCEVLEYLHTREKPIIYRDMKPGNVMIKPGAGVVLFDFGIAREYKVGALDDTRPYGTPGYAAPEQMEGTCQSDVRTDIYSLGATMYHMATGENPRKRGHEALAIRQVNPSLSNGLENIILKCTKTNPEERYNDCAELLYDLENYDHMDNSYRKKLKNRVAAFLVPLLISLAMFGGAFYCYQNILAEQKNNYTVMLNSAQENAINSIYQSKYEPGVLADFTKTIDLDPSREEGYLGLLDYVSRVGETQAGLDVVCSRIDVGNGGIDKNNNVLLRVAQLYFGGNNNDSSFTGDYTKAAKYFSKINVEERPEAAYYSELSMALGSFRQDIDWEAIGKTLADFTDYNEKQILSVGRLRNEQLVASVYVDRKRELGAAGIDSYERAIFLLERALAGTKDLIQDSRSGKVEVTVDELEDLQRQLLRDLASDYAMAYTMDSKAASYDRSIALYTELLGMLSNEEKTKEINFRMADVYEQKGNANEIRQAYENLISNYSTDAEAYVSYASWLYKQGELKKAVEIYKAASKCDNVEGNTNYASLGIKLKNADAL